MSRIGEKIKLKSVLGIVGSITVGLFFFISLSSQAIFTYNSMVAERRNHQHTVANLILDSIRQPLLQGSLLEAKARLENSLDRAQADCASLTVDSFNFAKCRTENSQNIKWDDIDLSSVAEMSAYKSSSLKIGFDESPLRALIAKQMGVVILISLLAAGLMFAVVRFAFRFIETEVSQLMETVSAGKGSRFSFKTFEFGVLKERLDELIADKAKLIESEAFSSLAKQVVHDIRSPLSTLKILSKKGVQNQDALELLGAATDRLNGIADNLLNYANPKMNSGCSLVECRNAITALMAEHRFQRTHVAIQMEVAGSNWESRRFHGDKNILVAAIDNLLRNAMEALADRSGLIKVIQTLDLDSYIITVEDNGPGVSAQVLAELGKQQVISSKAGGHGVGLYLIAQKVRADGGEISFAKSSTGGLLAKIRFPIG